MREWLQRQPADSSHLPAIRFTGRAYQKVNAVPPVPPWTTGVGKATTSTRTLTTFVPFNTVLVSLWLLASVSTATSLWWSVWQQAWQERMILIPVWDNLIRFRALFLITSGLIPICINCWLRDISLQLQVVSLLVFLKIISCFCQTNHLQQPRGDVWLAIQQTQCEQCEMQEEHSYLCEWSELVLMPREFTIQGLVSQKQFAKGASTQITNSGSFTNDSRS